MMMTEVSHVDMFFQMTAGFSANVNIEATSCTFEDKFAAPTLTPEWKFSRLFYLFVKIKTKLIFLVLSLSFVVCFSEENKCVKIVYGIWCEKIRD